MDQTLRERFDRELEPVVDLAYRYALRLTRDSESAMDLVQDAVVLAYRHFENFTPGTNFKAWLLRILTNKFLKDRQRAARAVQVAFDEVEEAYIARKMLENGIEEDDQNPASVLMNKLGVEEIAAAIDTLPDEFRTACSLYFLEESPYQEIAEVLEVPIGTVRSRLHRGRRLLQKALWELAVAKGITINGAVNA
ncbi:MAG: sigma-70 family RNA polymerase sigma factor [Armatimonadetes bacterium]|nr:sigma-70 family RNA polymerase sigma factor [Armatimonadota bacterium]